MHVRLCPVKVWILFRKKCKQQYLHSIAIEFLINGFYWTASDSILWIFEFCFHFQFQILNENRATWTGAVGLLIILISLEMIPHEIFRNVNYKCLNRRHQRIKNVIEISIKTNKNKNKKTLNEVLKDNFDKMMSIHITKKKFQICTDSVRSLESFFLFLSFCLCEVWR